MTTSKSKKGSKPKKRVIEAVSDVVDADKITKIVARTGSVSRHQGLRGWDTSKGRKWVVVAFWGEETTVSFHRDEDEANEAYEDATNSGADAFYAKTARMMLQSDPIGDERTR